MGWFFSPIFKEALYFWSSLGSIKVLRKTEFSEFFIFASFRIVPLWKFGKTRFSEFAKISRKKFGNMFGSKNPLFEAKTEVLGSNTWVLWSKTGVSLYSEFTEYSEFVLFRIFRNYKKMMSKLRKTHSDSNSDSNIWVRGRYAGPCRSILAKV